MSEMVFCRACGKEIHKTAPMCPGCGAPQIAEGGKSKTVAALLAIFLGGFGAHRFYLKKWWGILYLLFFWTWIPGLIALVEGVVFACTSPERWDAKHNKGIPSGRAGGSAVIIVFVAVAVGLFLIGILAAIAIPAYQDYKHRAKVREAVTVATVGALAVGDYMSNQRSIPVNLEAAGYRGPMPASVQNVHINATTAEIVVTMAGKDNLGGKTFALRPVIGADKRIVWQCVGLTVPNRTLPPECRSNE